MDRYIGIDVHARSCTVAVVDAAGKRVGEHVVETNGQALVECLRMVPGQRHVCIEEGTQSAWLYEILAPHAQQMVVTNVTDSRGQKSDQRDAFGLAEKLRTGSIEHRVFKEVGDYRTLRELGRVHSMVVRDSVRVQNRIKSFMRSRGVAVEGKAVYAVEGRKEYLEKLPQGTRAAVATLYAEYDVLEELRKRAEKELVAEARLHSASKILATCPGIGAIRAARLLPIVVTPHRFRTKRQFWSYCGLGIVMRSSADWVRDTSGSWQRTQMQQTRGLNLTHNHQLKAIFKGAATTVLCGATSRAELKRWITVTAPVLSAPRMPSRRARRLSQVVTAATNSPSTTVVSNGSIASFARKPCGTVRTHGRTGTCGRTFVTNRAAKSHMRRPMQLGQKPRR